MTHAAGRNSLIYSFCAGVMVNVLISVGMAAANAPLLHGTDGNYPAFRTHTYHNLFISWVVAGLLSSLLWGKVKSRNLQIAVILVLVILVLDALFLVRGRSAQILLLIMVGLLCLRRWGLRALLPTVIATAVLLPSLYVTSPVIREGTALAIQDLQERSRGNEGSTSLGLRMEFAQNTLEIIKEAPIFGQGTGSFRHNYEQLTGFTKASHGERACHNPHNDYLWLWSEVGLLGALGLMGILLAFVYEARRLTGAQKFSMEAIALSMLVGTLANSFFTDNISGVGFMVVACALVGGPCRIISELEAA
jgi:O-antigen ligase